MTFLADVNLQSPGDGPMGNPRPAVGNIAALQQALLGLNGGRLPPSLLFSDRDFDENDYEALLALDDTVENRKGALPAE